MYSILDVIAVVYVRLLVCAHLYISESHDLGRQTISFCCDFLKCILSTIFCFVFSPIIY